MTGMLNRVLNWLADYIPNMIVTEMITLATNVSVAANSTTPSYTIPAKSGHKIGSVTPIVTGSYWGWYNSTVSGASGQPRSIYFRNQHSSAHTNSFYVYVTYVKTI